MEECWYHNSKCLEEPPEGYYGFIYKITIFPHGDMPKDLWEKIYIGKKAFTHATKKRISKREIKTTKTRKRIQRGTKDSGWLNYWGSSLDLKADLKKYGSQYFYRQILEFAKTKSELSYLEIKWQCHYDVLRRNSYNGWIKATIYKKSL